MRTIAVFLALLLSACVVQEYKVEVKQFDRQERWRQIRNLGAVALEYDRYYAKDGSWCRDGDSRPGPNNDWSKMTCSGTWHTVEEMPSEVKK